MKKMTRMVGAAMLMALGMTGAARAEGAVSATVGFTTDYVFRGVTQTDNAPAVQGSFDYTNGPFYAGVWGSNVDFGGDESMELDAYFGVTPTTGPINWNLGIVGYFYPGAADDGTEYDYFEGIVGATLPVTDQISIGGKIAYSPEFFGETGAALYYELNGSLALSDAASLSAAWGNQDVDDAGDYDTWNVGGSYTIQGFKLDLRYHATDISGLDDIVALSVSRTM